MWGGQSASQPSNQAGSRPQSAGGQVPQGTSQGHTAQSALSAQEQQARQQEQSIMNNCIAELCNPEKSLAYREDKANQLMEHARTPRKAQLMAKPAAKVALSFLQPNHPLAKKGAGLIANMAFNQWLSRGKDFQTSLANHTVGHITQLLILSADPETESELLRALWTTTWRNTTAANLVNACRGAVTAVVERLVHHNLSVVIQAGGVLWSLARSKECAAAIHEAGGVGYLMSNLSHPNVEVQYTSVCALGILVHESEASQKEALNLGCIDKFMGYLDSSSSFELSDKQRSDLASKAAEGLTLICFDKPNAQARFVADGHMTKLRGWLQQGKMPKGLDARKLLVIILAVCFNNIPQQITFASQGGLQQFMELFPNPNFKYLAGLALSTLCHVPLVATLGPQELRQRYEQIAEMRKYVYQTFDHEAPMQELIRLLELPLPTARNPNTSQDFALKMNVGLLILSNLCCPAYPNLQRRFANQGGMAHLTPFIQKNETIQMGSLALSNIVQGPLIGPTDLDFLSAEDTSDPNGFIRNSVASETNTAVLTALCKAVKNVRSPDGRPDDSCAAAGAALASLALGGNKDLLRVLGSSPELDPLLALRALANKSSDPNAQGGVVAQDAHDGGVKRKLEGEPDA